MALTRIELWHRIEALELALVDLMDACELYHDYDKCSGAGCDLCAAIDNASDCLQSIEEDKENER